MAQKTESFDAVRFLISCIGHATNGRPDFEAVASDVGIVTKAAAQKRYERMLKAHGVTKKPASQASNSAEVSSGGEKTPKSTPRKRKPAAGPATKASPAKKTKGKAQPKAEESDEDVKMSDKDVKNDKEHTKEEVKEEVKDEDVQSGHPQKIEDEEVKADEA